MKKILLLILLITFNINAQEKDNIFKTIYKDFLKYGTVYAAGDIKNSVEAAQPVYFVRTDPSGNIYDPPIVEDNTPEFPFDYRYGIGIRKLARFDYERKPKNFYDGTETQLTFVAPTSAVKGLEYQVHFEKERFRGDEFENHNIFLKHTGKHHIVKAQSREVGKINLKFQSGEIRARLPIGKKFSISAGGVYRTHTRAYGYNPIEIWLNETQLVDGQPQIVNPWYTLGYNYGYTDHFVTITDGITGEETYDWHWQDPNGNVVAHTDLEFRETVFTQLMNRYNNDKWSELDAFGEIAPIVGVDFYHFKSKFWLHAYANYILPYHKYIQGDTQFSYLNRDNWGLGGLKPDSTPKQWDDYSAGMSFGWKVGKNIGVFVEGEYAKFWDSKLFNTTFGINFTFK